MQNYTKNKPFKIISKLDEKNYENVEKKNDDSEEDGNVDDYSDEMRKKKKFIKNNIVTKTGKDITTPKIKSEISLNVVKF